ncbi:MAG TPA: FAD-dependent oxidoreductase [Burkholderiales bacterium]|jgi:D-amino-acid dehydrogenase|nr:FAD-dependent oxidoreductase [Burkholderiales bacterium]
MPEAAPTHIVIGAGIVGAAIAHALQKRGARVTLIERAEPGRGASYGNSGALSPGSVAPLAMPGVLKTVPGMLLDPQGPLHVPPDYMFTALPWLLRFVAASTPERVAKISDALAKLHAGAIDHHLALAREIGAPELIIQRGHLHMYPDQAALAKDAAGWKLREQHGVKFERIDRAGILALEPQVGPRYQVAIHMPEQATVVNPFRYVTRIVAAFVANGGRVEQGEVQRLESSGAPGNSGWRCVGAARSWEAPQVVIAAGAWSLRLLEGIGMHVPLETQRGYHVTFKGVVAPITRTVVLADRKAFLAPMEEGLRIGGTVEFGGLERLPDYRRARLLAQFARETFPGLDDAREDLWMGHRPCFPDTLPRVGPAPEHPGLWLAFGHGHLGLTDSVNTARLLAEIITE